VSDVRRGGRGQVRAGAPEARSRGPGCGNGRERAGEAETEGVPAARRQRPGRSCQVSSTDGEPRRCRSRRLALLPDCRGERSLAADELLLLLEGRGLPAQKLLLLTGVSSLAPERSRWVAREGRTGRAERPVCVGGGGRCSNGRSRLRAGGEGAWAGGCRWVGGRVRDCRGIPGARCPGRGDWSGKPDPGAAGDTPKTPRKSTVLACQLLGPSKLQDLIYREAPAFMRNRERVPRGRAPAFMRGKLARSPGFSTARPRLSAWASRGSERERG